MSELKRIGAGKRLSEATVHNGVVYLAGQIADEDPKANIDGQMREALGHVERLLKEAGSDKSRILSCQIYLADMKDYDGMNAVWDEWVPKESPPSRATVQAALANAQWLVEVVVTAAVR